jgi:hypothetical protein
METIFIFRNKKVLRDFSFHFLLIVLVTVFLNSCQQPTIENQVEKLIKTEDFKQREQIAFALADSLDPYAVELLSGLYNENQYADQALESMLSRYSQILQSNQKSSRMLFKCVSLIPTESAAIFLGEQSVKSSEGDFVFQLIKNLPEHKKIKSVYSGLYAIGSEVIQDSLLSVFYSFNKQELINVLNDPYLVSLRSFQKIISNEIKQPNIKVDEKINLIVNGLGRPGSDDSFQLMLIDDAKKIGKPALLSLISEWDRTKSDNILRAITAFNNNAIQYLTSMLGEDSSVEELLAKIGQPAVVSLISKMKDSKQEVRFAAADALVKMYKYNPSAIASLTDAFANQSISAIAKNYPFYIRMGLSGTEELLLKALNTHFTKSMGEDYINCGNSRIEENAKNISANKGYGVYTLPGTHSGPRWGGGN